MTVDSVPAADSVGFVVAFGGALAVTRLMPFFVVRRGEGEEITADEALLVTMLVVLPAGGVMVAALVGFVVSHVVRRRATLKTLFNLGVELLAVSCSLLAYQLAGGTDLYERSPGVLAAAAAGALTYSAVTAGAVWTVIAAATGIPLRRLASEGLLTNATTAALVTGWGVLATAATSDDGFAVALVAVPIAVSWLLRRDERQRRALQALLDAAIETTDAVRRGTVPDTLAGAADRVLGTEGARLDRRPPGPGEVGTEVSTRAGTRWLIVGHRHRWNRRGRDDQARLDALAAIGAIALDNATLLDAAGRDPDTSLLTGALLQDRIDLLLDRDLDGQMAVIVVKVGRLQLVKQALGPGTARAQLAEIGHRLDLLAKEIPAGGENRAVLGYLGDGDFAIAVPTVGGSERALGVARMILHELSHPVLVNGVELFVDAGVGVALHRPTEQGAESAARMMRDALVTAAHVARSGGERVQLAHDRTDEPRRVSLAVEGRLRQALQRKELTVAYQPVVSLSGNQIIGAEGLVRWNDPAFGPMGPSEFIPVAESSGLIVDLDRYVLRRATADLAEWARSGLPAGFTISVNMSARHLTEPDTVSYVRKVLDDAGVEPGQLTLEVTESSVMVDALAAAANLEALASLGVRIAIDDFGTGYSSLLYLRDFPVDALKIDQSFVDRMIVSTGDAAIVAAVVRLAQTLGLRTVAEGVENVEQLAALRALGCDAGQGFLWSEAVHGDQLLRHWLGPAVREGLTERAAPVTGPPDEIDGVRDDVLAYLVHELRSPLTTIDGFAQLAAGNVQSIQGAADLAFYLDRISHGAAAMRRILDDLDDLSSASFGGIALEQQVSELNGVVRSIVDSMAPVLSGHPVQLSTTGPVHVSVDVPRMDQVLRNLLSNAAKFSPPGAAIDVRIVADGRHCQIDVRDHGCGVPPDRRRQLFRRFARLGTTTKGMGIGLHLARSIARAHGGDVMYRPPSDGDGSIFVVRLPLVDDRRSAESTNLLPFAARRVS